MLCGKITTVVIILVAVILAILASVLPPEQIDYVVAISKFFDVMLPILAVGALLKYLLKCPKCMVCSKCKSGEKCDK